MWLDRKRNRRADHLIYTLKEEMLPYYETRHNSQELGFDGSNLAQKRRKEILARSPEVPAESIRAQGDGDRYSVQSVTNPSCTYLVKLCDKSCDCPDWPRVRLCKHVAAVVHFFETVELTFETVDLQIHFPPVPETVNPAVAPAESEDSPDARSNASAAILEKVISVSREFLSDGAPSSPGTVRSLQVVEAHLTAVVRSSRSSESPLPDKEEIAPNQHSWTETAQQMGVQRRKRHRPATASTTEPSATQRIGELNRKCPRLQDKDPYSGGMNSGRHAAPDAQSTAQNVEARERAALGAGPVLSQARKRGRKCAGTPALALPPSPSPLQSWPPPHSPYHTWYTQPATFNAAASTPGPTYEGTSTAVATPPAPAHAAWYPAPAAAAYPLGGGGYTAHWPYGQFYPPQPR
jgi:hypothetical protein